MNDAYRDAVRLFTDLTGRNPDVASSAPGRVNLIGEHTDYNKGFVLPFAIDRRTFAVGGLRTDGMIRVASTLGDDVAQLPLAQLPSAQRDGLISGWSAYPLGVAWALGAFGIDLDAMPGVDLVIDSSVPVGAGLSSSAAIEAAVALALTNLWQIELSRPTLAAVGQRAENEVVGAPTGIMDQSASLLAKPDSAVFLDCLSLESELVALGFAAAGLSVLVIDTGVTHAHSMGGYSDRRRECETGARELGVESLREVTVDDLSKAESILDPVVFRRVRHVVTENQRVLDTVAELRSGKPTSIGELLDASHRSLRDDFEVSTPELDLAVDLAVRAEAIGARMTGGGFGGSAIAVVREADVASVRTAIADGFAEQGIAAPKMFEVVASDGARQENAEPCG